MLRRDEIAEELYEKLKLCENPDVPLSRSSLLIAGGSGGLQKILDILEDLPKKSRAEIEIERPDYSQFRYLKDGASATFKIRASEYLSQWGIKFIYKISISRNLYEALINYVDEHGLVKEED